MKPNDFLNGAIKAIGDRAAERDIDEERSAERAAHMFSALTGRDMTELEAWQFMCCLKLVRSATGKFKADDFVDLAGYAALAGEAAEKDSQNHLESSKKLWDDFWNEKGWRKNYERFWKDPKDYHGGNMIGGYSPGYRWTTSAGATDWSKV